MTVHRATTLAAVLLPLLASCAEIAFRHPVQELEFELAGRIAVRYNGEAASGNIAWRHRRDADEMLLTTPAGQGMARIAREDGAVTVTTADAKTYRADTAEALTEQALGFRVPLTGLADWVRARPAPGPAQVRRDEQGRLAYLEQQGWTIEYLGYGEDGLRPSRMKLVYPGVEMRLAISGWR